MTGKHILTNTNMPQILNRGEIILGFNQILVFPFQKNTIIFLMNKLAKNK